MINAARASAFIKSALLISLVREAAGWITTRVSTPSPSDQVGINACGIRHRDFARMIDHRHARGQRAARDRPANPASRPLPTVRSLRGAAQGKFCVIQSRERK